MPRGREIGKKIHGITQNQLHSALNLHKAIEVQTNEGTYLFTPTKYNAKLWKGKCTFGGITLDNQAEILEVYPPATESGRLEFHLFFLQPAI